MDMRKQLIYFCELYIKVFRKTALLRPAMQLLTYKCLTRFHENSYIPSHLRLS